MKLKDIHVGAEVYWEDPDGGVCSGHYRVIEIGEDDGELTVLTLSNQHSYTEAYLKEVE